MLIESGKITQVPVLQNIYPCVGPCALLPPLQQAHGRELLAAPSCALGHKGSLCYQHTPSWSIGGFTLGSTLAS